MSEKPCVDFCIYCRKETAYELRKIPFNHRIRGKDYSFIVTAAICKECGEEMSVPGMMDRQVREIEVQYCAAEHINIIPRRILYENEGDSNELLQD